MGVDPLARASCVALKFIDVRHRWPPLTVADIGLSCVLQILVVKHIDGAFSVGLVADEIVNRCDVLLANNQQCEASMHKKIGGVHLDPRILSVFVNLSL